MVNASTLIAAPLLAFLAAFSLSTPALQIP
jgi:hypothetical protein